MRPLTVLLTNNTLASRGGSETYVHDVALALLRRGHRPVAFSTILGGVADALRRATVPVIQDLTRVGDPPDVIHGHHHLETLMAALMFPGTPVVNFCHGWVPWEEMPLRHPSVRRYVAVDEVCVDRLVREEGIPSDRIELLLNFVDLERFRPRDPLPPRPRRALVMSNVANGDGYARVIAAACQSSDIAVDVLGLAAGNATEKPEEVLRGYDLVFAKGRSALEALSVGCATILADAGGAGPLVTPENFERLRVRNFGIRTLAHAHDASWYAEQIAGYQAAAAADVSARIRSEAGMEPAIDRLLEIYAAAMIAPADGDGSAAASMHCARVAGPLKQTYALSLQVQTLSSDLAVTRAERDALHALLAAERDRCAAFESLPTLRLRDAVLRVPVAGPMLQRAARGLAGLFR
jgi:hypothetical protein